MSEKKDFFSLFPSLVVSQNEPFRITLEWKDGEYKYKHKSGLRNPLYEDRNFMLVSGTNLFLHLTPTTYYLRDSEGTELGSITAVQLPEKAAPNYIVMKWKHSKVPPVVGPLKVGNSLLHMMIGFTVFELDLKRRSIRLVQKLPINTYYAIRNLGFVTVCADGKSVETWEWFGEEEKYRTGKLAAPGNFRMNDSNLVFLGNQKSFLSLQNDTTWWCVESNETFQVEKGYWEIPSPNLTLSGSYGDNTLKRRENGKWVPITTFKNTIGLVQYEGGCLFIQMPKTSLVIFPRPGGYENWVKVELGRYSECLVLPPNQEQVETRIQQLSDSVSLPKCLLDLVVDFC